MADWIDGTYELGDIGFRIDKSNPIRRTATTLLSPRPAHTNQSHEPRLYGWCGAWNDTNTYGNGIYRIVRVAGNGRVQIAEVRDRQAVADFLEAHGYPELLAQWDDAHAPRTT